jgi:SAM-dependent methyltransferase
MHDRSFVLDSHFRFAILEIWNEFHYWVAGLAVGTFFVVTVAHLQWSLDGFNTLDRLGYAGGTRYPVKYLRYWFCRCMLERLHTRLGRPIRVLEVGIADGKMLAFMAGAPKRGGYALPGWIERWDGVDVALRPALLERYSYSELTEADAETPPVHSRAYDAVVLLHVLEHLFEPEAAMAGHLELLSPGGILLGGSPTMPSLLAGGWERLLRRRHAHIDVKSHRHLSVMTPRRIRRFAKRYLLGLELLTGTFFLRWSEMFLENSQAWLRANLLWGALLPALGGEVYFALRKPE